MQRVYECEFFFIGEVVVVCECLECLGVCGGVVVVCVVVCVILDVE